MTSTSSIQKSGVPRRSAQDRITSFRSTLLAPVADAFSAFLLICPDDLSRTQECHNLTSVLLDADQDAECGESELTGVLSQTQGDVCLLRESNSMLSRERGEARSRVRQLERSLAETSKEETRWRLETLQLRSEVEPLRKVLAARERAHEAQKELVHQLQESVRNLRGMVNTSKLDAVNTDRITHEALEREVQRKERDVVRLSRRLSQVSPCSFARCSSEASSESHTVVQASACQGRPVSPASDDVSCSSLEALPCTPFQPERNLQPRGQAIRESARSDTSTTRSDLIVRVNLSDTDGTSEMELSASEVAELFHENERLHAASRDLEAMCEEQKSKQAKLRGMVTELMRDLKDQSPDEELASLRTQVQDLQRDRQELARQLRKLTAEYQAVSTAHEFSSAELSKLRGRDEQSQASLGYRSFVKRRGQKAEQASLSRGGFALANVENVLGNRSHR